MLYHKRCLYHLICYAVVLYAGIVLFGCGYNASEKTNEAYQLGVKARQFTDQRNYEEAYQAISAAIQINIELQQDSLLSENLLTLASIHRLLGQYDSTYLLYKKIIERSRLLSDRQFELKAKIKLAEFLAVISEYSEAVSTGNAAATLARFSSDWISMFNVMKIVGQGYHGLGKYDAEIKILDSLAELDNRHLNNQFALQLFQLRMICYAAQNKIDSVHSVFSRWKFKAKDENDFVALTKAYIRWGLINQVWERYDTSSQAFSQALDLFTNCPDLSVRRQVLVGMGNCSYKLHYFENAKRFYTDALELARKANDIPLEQLLNLQLLSCDWNINRHDTLIAAEMMKRCAAIEDTCRQNCFFAGEKYSLFFLGRLADQRNQLTAALKYYQQAMRRYEEDFPAGLNDELRFFIELFMENEQSGWYDAPLQVYCSAGTADDAFTLIERKNLQDIVQLFSRLHIMTGNGAVNQMLTRLQWKRRALALLEHDIMEELSAGAQRSTERLQILKELYPARLKEISDEGEELNRLSPNISSLVHLKLLSMKAIRDTLPSQSALIEYLPLPSALCVFVVRHDTAYLKKVDADKQRLLSLIEEYDNLICGTRLSNNKPFFNGAAAAGRIEELSSLLQNLLIDPVASYLVDVEKLYIVSPKEFGWLPFHTLRAEGKTQPLWLTKRFDIHYLPSAATLLFTAKKEDPVQTVAGVGYPGSTTWDVEYELKDVRAFYKEARLWFTSSATLDTLSTAKCDLLHIVADFTLDTVVPDNSRMILSDGATLYGIREISLGEMFKVPAAQTIVFSNISQTAGGLSRYAPMAFLANGSQTVIAMMWQGERKAKKYFGEVFYTNLLAGMSSHDAYRQAMLALIKEEQYAQAYRWGLFYQFGR